MTLDTFRTALDVFFLLVALPVTGFKVWRKLDERLSAQDAKLSKIDYALFNDGRGMETQLKETNKDVKELVKNQQQVMTDIAVLKAVRQTA